MFLLLLFTNPLWPVHAGFYIYAWWYSNRELFYYFPLFALVKRVSSWMESEQKMGWQFGEIMDSMRLYFAHWSQWYFCFSFWFPVYKWFLLLWIEQLMHHITPVMGVLGIILPFQEGILVLTSFHVMASVTSSFSNSTIV